MAEWKPVIGFEKFYEVSDEGQVRRIAQGRGTRVGKVLKPQVDRKGYRSIMTCVAGVKRVISLHRAVLDAFVGPQPTMEANHENGDKSNCALSNLVWMTPVQNKVHMYQTGLRKRQLTDSEVEEIRTAYASGKVSQDELGKLYGVSQRLISGIVRGKVYGFKITGTEAG
jgi:hypothetical protein